MVQVDVGASADYGVARSGVSVYHAWVEDYVTLDFLDTGASSAYAFVNTPHATLAGFEAYGECDITTMLTGFGTMSFVEGRDHSRNETISRQRQLLDPTAQSNERSGPLNAAPGALAAKDSEALAVLAPLTNRVGLRLHPEGDASLWNIEFAANIIDNQDRVASSLRELITPGYTTYDLLAHGRMTDSFTVTTGVRNLTDKQYQTYFDTRQAGSAPITSVFQPGISFYIGCEYTR
jgi:outer membrane receptor protein involved in Fe transport